MNIFRDETIKIHNQQRINVLKCHKINKLFFKACLMFKEKYASVRFQAMISEMK